MKKLSSFTPQRGKQNAKTLVACFSRAEENYGVGVIEKGNTELLAEMITKKTNAALFHIERKTPYPAVYHACIEEAKAEKNANARPALINTINISEYDVIFLGYPIWWDDLPMPVYTFLENRNWEGKSVCPFSTSEGSGLAETVSTLRTECVGAAVTAALTMTGRTAQNNREKAESLVDRWLETLGL